MADLMTSDRRVGPAIGLTWLPSVSHQAVYDVPRAVTARVDRCGTGAPHPAVRFRRWRHARAL
jgi:hypothetical protein